jgi:hypothetical protein
MALPINSGTFDTVVTSGVRASMKFSSALRIGVMTAATALRIVEAAPNAGVTIGGTPSRIGPMTGGSGRRATGVEAARLGTNENAPKIGETTASPGAVEGTIGGSGGKIGGSGGRIGAAGGTIGATGGMIGATGAMIGEASLKREATGLTIGAMIDEASLKRDATGLAIGAMIGASGAINGDTALRGDTTGLARGATATTGPGTVLSTSGSLGRSPGTAFVSGRGPNIGGVSASRMVLSRGTRGAPRFRPPTGRALVTAVTGVVGTAPRYPAKGFD